eukprot:15102059-Alexandrium_andersonii.AAC.1
MARVRLHLPAGSEERPGNSLCAGLGWAGLDARWMPAGCRDGRGASRWPAEVNHQPTSRWPEERLCRCDCHCDWA